jgi:hypothetical protein
MVNKAACGAMGISTQAPPEIAAQYVEPTDHDAEITPKRMPSILDRKACSRSGATIGWSAGGELIRGTGLTMIEHPESHEICRRGASTYFYFRMSLFLFRG